MVPQQATRAETAWFLDTCRRLVSSEPDTCTAPPPDADPRELAAMVVTTRTASLLGWAVRERHLRLNDELAEVTTATYRAASRQVPMLVDEVASVADAMPDGTRAIARKGLHLSQLYPAAGTRPLTDADLLIHPADEPAIDGALTSRGFQQGRLAPDHRSIVPWNRTEELYFKLATNALPYYVKFFPTDAPSEWVMIDLSTKVLPPGLGESISIDDVWHARRKHPDVPLAVMSAEHLAIDLCINLYVTHSTLAYIHRGRYRRLLPYLDLLVIAPTVDWAQVADLCVDHPELVGPVGFAVGNLCRLYPDALAPDLLARLAPTDDPEALDRIGELELDRPYVWRDGLVRRMFEVPTPDDIPATSSPI